MKISKDYILEFAKDYGPPTLLSILWAFYIVYQKPEEEFWTVFIKNFVPAFFVLNYLSMRVNRTKKNVEKKHKSKATAEKLAKIDRRLENIENLLKEKENPSAE